MDHKVITRWMKKYSVVLKRYFSLSPTAAASLLFIIVFFFSSKNFHDKLEHDNFSQDALLYASLIHRQFLSDMEFADPMLLQFLSNVGSRGSCSRLEKQFSMRRDLLKIFAIDANNSLVSACGTHINQEDIVSASVKSFAEKNFSNTSKGSFVADIFIEGMPIFPESSYFVAYYPKFYDGKYVGALAFLYQSHNFFSDIVPLHIGTQSCIEIMDSSDSKVLASSKGCSVIVTKGGSNPYRYERVTTIRDNRHVFDFRVIGVEPSYSSLENYIRLSTWMILIISVIFLLFYRSKSHYIQTQRRDLLGLSLAALCVFDREFRFCRVNEIFTSYAGSMLHVIGQELTKFVSPECYDLVEEKLNKILSGSVKRVFFEAEFVFNNSSDGSTDGDRYWLVWEIHDSSDGEYFTAIAQDITAHKKIQRALIKEKAFRQAIGDSMITGVQVTDMNGTVTYVNHAFSSMTGYSVSECLNTYLPFPYELNKVGFLLEDFIKEGCDKSRFGSGLEVRVMKKDGTDFEAHLYVSPLTDQNKNTFGWIFSVIDVTEKNRVRRILENNHQQFTTVINSLEAAVCVFDQLQLRVLFYNAYYHKNFGSSPDMHLQLCRSVPKASRSGSDQYASAEVYVESLQRWFEVRVRLIPWVDGRQPVVMSVSTDITKRKIAEQLYQQQQEKVQQTSHLITMGEMASSLSHELNQPLTAISNYSTGSIARLESGMMNLDEVLKVMRKNAFQADRAGRIIRSIRDFVKKNEPRFFLCNMNELLAEAVEFAEVDASKRNISIELVVDSQLPPISVDPILIQQVLINFIKNAVDAMQDSIDRVIRIEALVRDEVLEVSVFDRGHGINPDAMDKLFAPFFTTKTEGMGMGLNICRSIVEYHKGRLWAESNPGGGSIFRFTLPCVID
ncbi:MULTISPECIES: PAS domain S-box protein [Candidatus Ichthyocystis]|uniref:histidine kinase n=2 Tax=Candidatus Ichthyocystis TaxID=2929841 RepID=A0A0S4M363_9BURK|nr:MULTISPECIES: PAS domain S-box protein [Ichthyocystis]CUT18213.1 sensory histidine kinase [Candidatus Ichthyocystis hellenicum]